MYVCLSLFVRISDKKIAAILSLHAQRDVDAVLCPDVGLCIMTVVRGTYHVASIPLPMTSTLHLARRDQGIRSHQRPQRAANIT